MMSQVSLINQSGLGAIKPLTHRYSKPDITFSGIVDAQKEEEKFYRETLSLLKNKIAFAPLSMNHHYPPKKTKHGGLNYQVTLKIDGQKWTITRMGGAKPENAEFEIDRDGKKLRYTTSYASQYPLLKQADIAKAFVEVIQAMDNRILLQPELVDEAQEIRDYIQTLETLKTKLASAPLALDTRYKATKGDERLNYQANVQIDGKNWKIYRYGYADPNYAQVRIVSPEGKKFNYSNPGIGSTGGLFRPDNIDCDTIPRNDNSAAEAFVSLIKSLDDCIVQMPSVRDLDAELAEKVKSYLTTFNQLTDKINASQITLEGEPNGSYTPRALEYKAKLNVNGSRWEVKRYGSPEPKYGSFDLRSPDGQEFHYRSYALRMGDKKYLSEQNEDVANAGEALLAAMDKLIAPQYAGNE